MSPYEEDEDEVIEPLPSIRWSWMTIPILGAVVVAGVLESLADGVTHLGSAMASHSNWQREQKRFEEEATMAIEEITSA